MIVRGNQFKTINQKVSFTELLSKMLKVIVYQTVKIQFQNLNQSQFNRAAIG